MKKFIKSFIVFVLLLTILPLGNSSFAKESKDNQKEVPSVAIKEEIKSKWIEGDPKGKSFKVKDKELLIHNNGKPLETNILTENKENHKLFAVYQVEINGVDYESYYFENREESNLNNLKEQVKKDKEKIKNKSIQIEEEKNNKEKNNKTDQFTLTNIFNSLKSLVETPKAYAVASEPSGGYYRFYNWTFYGGSFGTTKLGVYSTVTHLDRKTASANIDGKSGSVWDIKADNKWDASSGRLDQQITRMAVPYTNQRLISYGPEDKNSGTVSVTLSQIVNPMEWTFTLNQFSVDDVSSTYNKYGRWIYNRNWGFPDPYITKPGIRVSNTSGNFAMQHSHSFQISYETHYTGTVTISVPDR